MLILLYISYIACNNLAHSMLGLINDHRTKESLKQLKSIQNLENAARDQALYMCENSNLTHSNPNGNLEDRIKRNGFKGSSIGENIAKNHSDKFEDVAKMWMGSPRHKKNILGEFNYTGIATCLDKKGSRFWVQVFGKDNNGQSEHDQDSSVSLEDRNEPTQYNTAEELIEPNIMNRRSNSNNYSPSIETKKVCFNIEDCMPMPTTVQSIFNTFPRPMPQSVRTSFIPISSVIYSTIIKTISQSPSIITITKTASPEPQQAISTIVLISTAQAERPISSILTVTAERPISSILTVTKTITEPNTTANASKSIAQIENTVTVTKTIASPITNTIQLERTVTVTSSAYKNEPKASSIRPKLVQLVPEREIDDFTQSDDFENSVEISRKTNLEKFKNGQKSKNFNRRNGTIENKLRKLLQGMKNGNENYDDSNLYSRRNKEFLNTNCGGADNPCIKAFILKE